MRDLRGVCGSILRVLPDAEVRGRDWGRARGADAVLTSGFPRHSFRGPYTRVLCLDCDREEAAGQAARRRGLSRGMEEEEEEEEGEEEEGGERGA